MRVTTKTTYLVDKHEFNTIDKAKEHIENSLGAVIDSMDNSHELTPKQRLHILKMLIDNKELLCKLLNVQFSLDDSAIQPTDINILDY